MAELQTFFPGCAPRGSEGQEWQPPCSGDRDSEAARARARARRLDPKTSHDAARTVERSGAAQAQRDACLDEVRRGPGQTAAEIALAVGLERHAPSRRLPELRVAGLVRNGEARKCVVMGRLALTWFAADAEAAP